MKNKTLLAGIALVTVFASCSKSSDENIPGAGNGEIRAVAKALSIDASAGIQSRAAYTATDAKGLQALVLGSQSTGDYTTAYAKGTMTFDATNAESTAVGFESSGFTGSTKLPADKSPLYLCALYPGTAANWTSVGSTASYTFNGTQDVMAAPQQELKKGVTETAAFAFAHLLTKVDITVKAENDDAVVAWGKVTKIVVAKVLDAASFNDKIAVTLADATATATAFSQATSGQPASWKTYTTADAEFTGQAVALTTTATPVATTIMAPFTATNAATDLLIAVTTQQTTGGTELVTNVAVSVPAGNTQGKQYSINLNFKAKDIKGTATVASWGTAVSIDKDVE